MWEVWVYKAAHTVTQADLNSNGGGDGKLENTADVVTLQTAKQSATADVLIDASGLLTIDKITIIGSQTGDGLTNVAVGTPVTWKYTVANTGNVSLNSVTVKDDAGIISNLTDDFTAT